EPPEGYLKSVLTKSYKEPLTPAELAKAGRLVESLNDLHAQEFLGADYKAAVQNRKELNEILGKVDGPSGKTETDKILKSLENDPALTKKIFGTEELPKEARELVERYKAGKIDGDKAQQELKQIIKERVKDQSGYIDARYKEYVSSEHELEAWVMGKDAKAAFNGEQPSTTLLDGPPATKRGIGDTDAPGADQGPRTKPGLGDDQGPSTKRGLGDQQGGDQGPGTKRGLADDPGTGGSRAAEKPFDDQPAPGDDDIEPAPDAKRPSE